MEQKFQIISNFIKNNKKIISIILTVLTTIIVISLIINWSYKKKLEKEKNTDVTNSIHSIVINENVRLNKKPKETFFSKIDILEKGTNAYILEEYIDENTKWYKVKCNDRIGYILQENLEYYIPSEKEFVLMSDVSKFNVQYEHFKNTKEYQTFLIENNINYVYIRAGGRGYGEEGNFYTDKNCEIFINACEYLKIPYGFYYIDEAINSEEIDGEVKFIQDFISKNATSMNKLPLAIDIEYHDGVGRADEMWKERAVLAEELVQKFNNAGIKNIIYSNARTANEYLSNVNTNFWVAYYPKIEKVPDFWYTDTEQEPVENLEFMEKVIAWQFTEDGAGDEIREKVDMSLVKNNFFRQFLNK